MMPLLKPLLLPLILLFPLSLEDGWLGIRPADKERPTVAEVIANSPAEKAGVKVGDVFLSVNGRRTNTVEALIDVIGAHKAGDVLKLEILRGKRRLQLQARLVKRPAAALEDEPEQKAKPKAKPKRAPQPRRAPRAGRAARPGRSVEQPRRGTKKVARASAGRPYLGAELEEVDAGLKVVRALPGSPAAKAGLRGGDLLRQMNRRRIKTLADLDRVLAGLKPGDRQVLGVTRNGKDGLQLPVTLGSTAAQPAARPGPGRTARPAPTRRPARPDQPAKPSRSGAAPTEFSANYSGSMAQARRSGKPVLLVFGASWCVNCKTLKKALQDPSLDRSLAGHVRIWLDTDQEGRLADKHGVQGLPHIELLTPTGQRLEQLVGFQPPAVLAKALGRSLAATKKSAGTPVKKPARKTAKKTARKPVKKPAKKPAARPTPRNRAGRAVRPNASQWQKAQAELSRLRREVEQLKKQQQEQKALLQKILKQLRERGR